MFFRIWLQQFLYSLHRIRKETLNSIHFWSFIGDLSIYKACITMISQHMIRLMRNATMNYIDICPFYWKRKSARCNTICSSVEYKYALYWNKQIWNILLRLGLNVIMIRFLRLTLNNLWSESTRCAFKFIDLVSVRYTLIQGLKKGFFLTAQVFVLYNWNLIIQNNYWCIIFIFVKFKIKLVQVKKHQQSWNECGCEINVNFCFTIKFRIQIHTLPTAQVIPNPIRN